MGTLFTDVYTRFFGKITDDMYLELTPRDTLKDLRQLIIDSIPGFEFPRKRLDYTLDMEVLQKPKKEEDLEIIWELLESAGIDTNGMESLDWGDIVDKIPDEYTLMASYEDGELEVPQGVLQWDRDGDVPDDKDFVIIDTSHFNEELTQEEINILAILMVWAWLQRQVTSVENTRMKYSGTEFKMTSQANHLSKLLSLQNEVRRQSTHMQRLYKRRKTDSQGYIRSNWSVLLGGSALD